MLFNDDDDGDIYMFKSHTIDSVSGRYYFSRGGDSKSQLRLSFFFFASICIYFCNEKRFFSKASKIVATLNST